MMGIYPDCPGNMNFTLSTPVFDQVNIYLNRMYYPGNVLTIKTSAPSKETPFIKRINWNGKRHKYFFIKHEELVGGGTLEFVLEGIKRFRFFLAPVVLNRNCRGIQSVFQRKKEGRSNIFF